MSTPNRHNNSPNMGNGGIGNLAQELQWVKNDCTLIRNAVVLLEQEKDNLRQAVRKLKIENQRQREKTKKLQAEIKKLGGHSEDTDIEDKDYDDIGRDFILVGGAQDPLALRFEVSIRDDEGNEHKSAERYYWYKLAEKFGDDEAKKKIVSAASTHDAEEAMKAVKGFNERQWNEEKIMHWSRGQELKFEQVRWIACVLVETKDSYIAVAHQDKQIGTGWRKTREEANKSIFWDGDNSGGKFLMKYRRDLIKTHEWAGPNERDETSKKILNLRKNVWRRNENHVQQGGIMNGMRGGMNGGGHRGGYNRGGYSNGRGGLRQDYGDNNNKRQQQKSSP